MEKIHEEKRILIETAIGIPVVAILFLIFHLVTHNIKFILRDGNDLDLEGYELVFYDEFEGDSLDLSVWEHRNVGPVKYHGNLVLNHCKNCLVEGIILRDAPMWSIIIRNDSENITVDNIKIIGQWRYNSDGINICTSKNVTVKNCFVRSFDDCIITRGAYLEGESGNVENATVENCVLWCDWGKSIETWCGHKATEIKNILFKNNYLIHLNAVALSKICGIS